MNKRKEAPDTEINMEPVVFGPEDIESLKKAKDLHSKKDLLHGFIFIGKRFYNESYISGRVIGYYSDENQMLWAFEQFRDRFERRGFCVAYTRFEEMPPGELFIVKPSDRHKGNNTVN